VVNVVDYLVGRSLIVEAEGRWELKGKLREVEEGVPESLREMIERQFEGLSVEEQRVLEAGSVAGVEFSAAAVAAALEEEVFQIEERCQDLARRGQFVRRSGVSEWPDGTVVGRYSFIHALYQNVLYQRLGVARRLRLHQRIGEREEAAYGGRAGEIAAELAMHFERGRDYRRAVQYLEQAGKNAIQRSAHREAISHLSKGLELLKVLPDTPERAQQELTLQIALGTQLMATKGYGAPEVGKAYARARELCQHMGETPQLFPVLRGLWAFYSVRTELQTARELGEQLLRMAQSVQDPAFLLEAHLALGTTLFHLGEFASARAHLEQGIALYDLQQHCSHAFLYGQDPGVLCLSYAVWALWYLGCPDQALKRSHKALALAQELSHPFSLAFALHFAAVVCQLRREEQAARERAEAMTALSGEQGFALFLALGTIWRGRAMAEQGQREEGIAQMRQGLAAFGATGVELGQIYYFALLAEAYREVGQTEEGLTALAEALAVAQKTGERFYEAELYRLKGELTLAQSRVQGLGSRVQAKQKAKGKNQKAKIESEAEACFRQAIDIARRQSAKSLELRAVVSLSRLWQRQGKGEEARKMLEEIYSWFTEGFDTADLREAKALLQEM
jgi:predicted ATPase